jgi:dihydrodipicolinate synthase/N-acetylneuraminate lyase
MKPTWKGVYPAITTPFTQDEELDIPNFRNNIEAQLEAGIHGLVIGGSLGEASTITTEEKQVLVKEALDVCAGKIPVLLNVAEGSTREAIRQAQLAESWGADGLMLLPPMRYKSDDRETVEHFLAVARAVSLPIMIYNNPVDYKIDTTPEMFDVLLEQSNIEAVKDSTRDITNITRLRNKFGDRLKILGGVDTLAMEALLMGADGWVGGLVCAFPKETVAIFHLVKAGRIAEALKIYRWFMPLLELDIHPKLVQYIKLCQQQAGLGTEYVRKPRLTLTGAEREQILEVINNGISTRPTLPDFVSI